MRRSGQIRQGCECRCIATVRRALFVVAGISVSLMPAGAVHAFGTDPTLSAETLNSSIDGDAAYTHAGFAAAGLTVKRIFVEGLQVGDEVTAVYGVPGAACTIQTDADPFFNALDVGQGHARPSSAFFMDNPTLQWDSWHALGNVAFFVSPGFPNVAQEGGGANVIENTDMAWFAVPGFITSDGRMLVGQFAFSEDSAFEYVISISVKRGTENLDFIGLTYSSGTFPDPIGACCVGLKCSEITESACATAGGTFHGADTLCARVSCLPDPPDPDGACCLGDSCVEATEEECAILGGVVGSVYHGDDTLCINIDCDAEVPGACCIDGDCVVVVESLCDLAQGTFSGEDTTCDRVDCNPPNLNGACCIFGECAEMTEEFCIVSTGTFSGVGTTCDVVADECANGPPTTGGCCIAGECTIMTEAQCIASFGEFQGLGSECDKITCPAVGACCVTGVCVQVSEVICQSRGGLFTDEGVSCDGEECELPAAVGSGCSGNFWHQPGLPQWPSPYRGGLLIVEVYDIPSCVTDWTIHSGHLNQTFTMSGGEGDLNIAARQLMRAAIPALLNAHLNTKQQCEAEYPIADASLLIQLVNEKLSTCDPLLIQELTEALSAYNALGCPVTRLGHCRDVAEDAESNNEHDD